MGSLLASHESWRKILTPPSVLMQQFFRPTTFLLFPNIFKNYCVLPKSSQDPRKAALYCCVSFKCVRLELWLVRKEVLGYRVCVYVVLIFHHPWHPGHFTVRGNQIPRLREDAGQCASLFYIICSGYDPSWANAGLLLKELCHPHEQDKKIEKNMWSWPYWQGEVGLSDLRLILVGIVIVRQR